MLVQISVACLTSLSKPCRPPASTPERACCRHLAGRSARGRLPPNPDLVWNFWIEIWIGFGRSLTLPLGKDPFHRVREISLLPSYPTDLIRDDVEVVLTGEREK